MDGRSGFATTLFKYNLNKSFIGIEWQYDAGGGIWSDDEKQSVARYRTRME